MGECEKCGATSELVDIPSEGFGKDFKPAKLLCKKCIKINKEK